MEQIVVIWKKMISMKAFFVFSSKISKEKHIQKITEVFSDLKDHEGILIINLICIF